MSNTQPLVESNARPNSKDELSFLERPERLVTIKNHLGFYPQSNNEASRITALIGHEDKNHQALTHLNEVSIHQYKAGASASEAVRSIVRSFEGYAGSAVNELYYMDSFLTDDLVIRANNRTGFTTLFPLEEWRYDNAQIAAFSAMSRFRETQRYAETEKDGRMGNRTLIDATSGEERLERIIENLGGLRVSELKRIADTLKDGQIKRLDFWIEQLEGSKKHYFARDVSELALKELVSISR